MEYCINLNTTWNTTWNTPLISILHVISKTEHAGSHLTVVKCTHITHVQAHTHTHCAHTQTPKLKTGEKKDLKTLFDCLEHKYNHMALILATLAKAGLQAPTSISGRPQASPRSSAEVPLLCRRQVLHLPFLSFLVFFWAS